MQRAHMTGRAGNWQCGGLKTVQGGWPELSPAPSAGTDMSLGGQFRFSMGDLAQRESALLCIAPTMCQVLFLDPAVLELSVIAEMRGDPPWDKSQVAAEVWQILHIIQKK